jgi:hypothetical protein
MWRVSFLRSIPSSSCRPGSVFVVPFSFIRLHPLQPLLSYQGGTSSPCPTAPSPPRPPLYPGAPHWCCPRQPQTKTLTLRTLSPPQTLIRTRCGEEAPPVPHSTCTLVVARTTSFFTSRAPCPSKLTPPQGGVRSRGVTRSPSHSLKNIYSLLWNLCQVSIMDGAVNRLSKKISFQICFLFLFFLPYFLPGKIYYFRNIFSLQYIFSSLVF